MKLTVIGSNVAHSLSPAIYRLLFARYGLGVAYGTDEIARDALPAFVGRARGALHGFNVTMPFKREILPLLDELGETALRYDSCNTVLVREGRLVGHSTDAAGFLRALSAHGEEVKGRRVLLLGAGGAAYAVAQGLIEAGCGAMCVVNRDEGKAMALAERLKGQTGGEVQAAGQGALARAAREADLLINATSLGMDGREPFPSLAFLEGFSGTVNDIVYLPRETALLARARALGLGVVPGLPMLVGQAIVAFEHYTGIRVKDEAFHAVLGALAEGGEEPA